MPINHSIEDLPRANRPEGNLPSTNNFVVTRVAEAWRDEKEGKQATGDLAHAIPDAGPYRGSYGSKRCDRALWYALHGEPESNPPSLYDYWRFGMGHMVHEMVQRIIDKLFPDAEIEAVIDLRPIGVPGSSHADLVINYEGRKLLVELKSLGGFRFKSKVTTMGGAPEGPDYGHIIQAGLAARAYGCDGIVIGYLALEGVSVKQAAAWTQSEEGRFAAEWHYTVDELAPHLDDEVQRINDLIAKEVRPGRTMYDVGPRSIPWGATITDPDRTMWILTDGRNIVDSGSSWECGYCPHRNKCIEDGA